MFHMGVSTEKSEIFSRLSRKETTCVDRPLLRHTFNLPDYRNVPRADSSFLYLTSIQDNGSWLSRDGHRMMRRDKTQERDVVKVEDGPRARGPF